MRISSLEEVSSITFFKFKGWDKLWGLYQMQYIYAKLAKVEGATFYKYMGSGGGEGFSLKPDFSVYALFICWKSQECAQNFERSLLYSDFVNHAYEKWTVYMVPFQAKGSWDKIHLFEKTGLIHHEQFPLAVLTRASIRLSKLIEFWKNVPWTSSSLNDAEGLMFLKGIGELPFVQQATFSIWQSSRCMQDYAYKGQHGNIIKKARKRGWYKEELFVRFAVIHTSGTWENIGPLSSNNSLF